MNPDTDREKLKRRRKRLEESKTMAKTESFRFQNFLDAFPFGIYIVNAAHEIEYANAVLQKEFGSPGGQKCYHYFHGIEAPCPWCKNEKVFTGETVIWNWHSEKTNRDYELFDLPLENEDGSISKIEIFNDITERLRLASELERFKLAVEQSADGIIMTGLDGVITYTNAAAKKIYGYTAGGLAGRHVRRLNAEREISDTLIIPEILTTGHWSGEVVQKRKNGSLFHAFLSCTLVREDKKPVAMLGIIRDITELKRKDMAVQKSADLLRQTQALTKTGGWELDVQTGRVTWTDEVYRIYGVDPETYDPNDIENDMDFYAPESRPLLKKAFEQALAEGRPYDLELRFIRANKERIWVRTMGRPEIQTGKVVRISGNFIDITASKLLAKEREQALNLLRKVYASLEEAVFAISPESRRILSCNAAAEKIFGYSKEEMIGKNTEFLHTNKKNYLAFGRKLKRALTSGTGLHMEFVLKKKNGSLFPSEHTVKPLQDQSGSPSMYVSVVRDLTFRKMAEHKLQNQQQELEKRARRLEELNATLKVLLDQREKEKNALETRFSESLDTLLPYLKKFQQTALSPAQKAQLDLLEAHVREMASPLHKSTSTSLQGLTPTEITVIDLIKLGYQTKEIASKLNVSTRTVEFHRDNIRKKLNLKGRKINLKTYLSSKR